ncbi:MAG TPA: hypothetical protein VHW65_03980 [Gemmatimonadales bacterium]|nr:hypothetical protein [Gemmatimonadales bacterium]
MKRIAAIFAITLAAALRPLPAQSAPGLRLSGDTNAVSRALAAERAGATAEAARQYAIALQQQPANGTALMGLERALPRLDRRSELLPFIARALKTDSSSIGVMLVAVRTFAALGTADSAAKYVRRWANEVPHDESPWREWSTAALEVRDMPQAMVALQMGRSELGGPPALGLELAQLLQSEGKLADAAREWIPVVRATPAYRNGAVSVLGQVPPAQRGLVRDALARDNSLDARQLLALLDVQWGDARTGATLLRGALPADHAQAIALIDDLLGAMHGHDDHASQLVRASTLELAATYETGTMVSRTLLDAANAYAAGGDDKSARRVLERVSADPAAPPGVAARTSTTMLGVLLAEGKPADAEQMLGQLATTLSPDQRDDATRRVADGWIAAGDLTRAARLVAADSSLEGIDLRGRIALYRGDLGAATQLFKAAGPYDDDRVAALRRVVVLSLLQAVGRDSLPALGAALLQLDRADSVHAASSLEAVASTLDSAGGAEVRLLAGRVALGHSDTANALRLFRLADIPGHPATAAAARLEVARISAAAGRVAEARSLLEQLILDFPESAAVPEARHLRDALAGAVPAGGA